MTHFLLIGWEVIGAAATCYTLPGSLELLTLTVAALLPRSRLRSACTLSPWEIAVVIPAHNEAVNIASCVGSVLEADRGDMKVSIYVIADNCSDNTALLARAAGATVLERSNEIEQGKGYALRFAFDQLAPLGHDATFVVDADTVVASNFLVAASEPMRAGAAAVQVRSLVRNSAASSRVRLMSLGCCAMNVVRPLGRERLGLSVGILGNGFGLRRETIGSLPYLTRSITEDLEYHLLLVRAGFRVTYVNETTVFGEMPVEQTGAKTQRSRWEGGRLRLLLDKGPALFWDILRGERRCIEPLLDLLLLPLAFHVSLLVVACLTTVPVLRFFGLFGLLVVILHLAAAIIVTGGTWRDAAILATAPVYVLWKLVLIPSLLRNSRRNQTWVRTQRNIDGP